MIAHKKNNNKPKAQQAKEEPSSKSMDEFDAKRKIIREKMKSKRVNYIVKDLPIY